MTQSRKELQEELLLIKKYLSQVEDLGINTSNITKKYNELKQSSLTRTNQVNKIYYMEILLEDTLNNYKKVEQLSNAIEELLQRKDESNLHQLRNLMIFLLSKLHNYDTLSLSNTPLSLNKIYPQLYQIIKLEFQKTQESKLLSILSNDYLPILETMIIHLEPYLIQEINTTINSLPDLETLDPESQIEMSSIKQNLKELSQEIMQYNSQKKTLEMKKEELETSLQNYQKTANLKFLKIIKKSALLVGTLGILTGGIFLTKNISSQKIPQTKESSYDLTEPKTSSNQPQESSPNIEPSQEFTNITYFIILLLISYEILPKLLSYRYAKKTNIPRTKTTLIKEIKTEYHAYMKNQSSLCTTKKQLQAITQDLKNLQFSYDTLINQINNPEIIRLLNQTSTSANKPLSKKLSLPKNN